MISHVKLAEADEEPVANYTRALQIVTELERAGRLSDNQSNWRSDLEGRLASVTR